MVFARVFPTKRLDDLKSLKRQTKAEVLRTPGPELLGLRLSLNPYMGLGDFSAFFVWRIFFSRVTLEPGLQFHANFNQTRRDVIRRPSPKEHDLRLLRKGLFPARY